MADGVTALSTGILHTRSISGFVQGTYAFLDDFELNAGVRYDSEQRDLLDSKLEVPNPAPGSDPILLNEFSVPEIDTSRWSPRVALQWHFADDSMLYGSYAIGYLSPTYNSVNFFVEPDFVKQERNDAYELGIKSSFFSGDLQLDAALFYTRRQDVISAYTTVTSGVAVRFYNAGPGFSRGFEFNVRGRPLRRWNEQFAVSLAGTYLDAEYTNFPDGRGYDDDTGLGFGPGNATGEARDFTGNRIVNSPRFSGTLTATQGLLSRYGSHGLQLAGDVYYNSGYFFTPQNTPVAEQAAHVLFNVRLTYDYRPAGLQLAIFGENLSDEPVLSSVFAVDTGPAYQLRPPRNYGLRAKGSF